MKTAHSWMSAADAARMLGVSRATLYAYVSRGFIRSQSQPGAVRERQYAGDDVERLRRRTEERRDPDKATARALQWGMPIMESSITLIDGNRLYYRGHDAVTLSRSVAEVASLIWTGRFETDFAAVAPRVVVAENKNLAFIARAQSMLAAASAHDTLAFDLRSSSVALTGWQIVQLLTRAATGSRGGGRTIDEVLARAWNLGARNADVIRSALILCADHELNVSSFTARCRAWMALSW